MWYLVLSRRVGSEQETQLHHEIHMEWLLEQHRQGRVLFSGPTSDRSCGIYVLLASSRAAAEEIAAGDPHHVHVDRKMEIFEWEPRRAMRLDGPTISELEAMATGSRSKAPA
jgi:uncharacterized protein YciI